MNHYDVLVIGGGHAGCEAALAAARMGCATMLITLDVDKVALMPCNPAIGGVGKGHMVREIDALGGEMAKVIDKTGIQFRVLNASKGPAVQGYRAQADKNLYKNEMRRALENQVPDFPAEIVSAGMLSSDHSPSLAVKPASFLQTIKLIEKPIMRILRGSLLIQYFLSRQLAGPYFIRAAHSQN